MAELFTSGRVADVVLAVLLLEALLLAFRGRRHFARGARSALYGFLAAGGFFALGLRGALTGADWRWVAAALVGAFLAHLAGLVRLGRRAGGAGGGGRTAGGIGDGRGGEGARDDR